MDNNNWRLSPPNGEPAMDAGDWRTQLPPDSRQKIVNKILETLMKHLPFSGPEGLNELRRIAARFEEKIFSGAVNQTDYLRKISTKMLAMETKSRNAAGSSPSNPGAAISGTSMDSSNHDSQACIENICHLMDNNNLEPSLPETEPVVNTSDWRAQQPQDSRQKNVNALMETLQKHAPYSGQEGINELMRIAVSFEELIFNTAINQEEYLGKISLKMQTVERGN